MIPLAYRGYSSKQQKHISLFFFFKCYRFAIIDRKQYSNHSAYIHIMHKEYKNYSILLLNCSYSCSQITLCISLTHTPLGISHSMSRCNEIAYSDN